MYKNVLTDYETGFLAKEQAIPQNTSVNGNGSIFDFSGMQSKLEAVAKVDSEITLASTKTITIKLQDSEDGVTYADSGVIFTETVSEETVHEAGAILGRFTPSVNAKPYTRAVLYSDDAAVVGSVSVLVGLLP